MEDFSTLIVPQLTQQKNKEQFDDTALSNLLDGQISNREKTSLLSLSQSKSRAWLTSAPIPALVLHLHSHEFGVALEYRLGNPLYESERRCPYCRSANLDIFGDYAVSCHGRGDNISRHDRIRNTLDRRPLFPRNVSKNIFCRRSIQDQATSIRPVFYQDSPQL